MADLIREVLPRVRTAPVVPGLSIYNAANAVLDAIHERLIFRSSDLAVYTSDLSVNVPALGYSGALPSNFISLAERPTAEDVVTNWMSGTVTSYDNVTGALVVSASLSNGTATLTAWSVVTGGTPATPPEIVGSSTTSLTVGTGSKSLTTQAGLGLVTGQYIIIASTANESDIAWYQKRRMDPMNEDDHDDSWWAWYAEHGEDYDPLAIRPTKYKIVGTTIYVRPRAAVTTLIAGRYNAKATSFSATTDVIPYNHLFDSVFSEGCVRILTKGSTIIDEDAGLSAFLRRKIDTIVDSRGGIMPQRRMRHSNYL
jgi:hypothetical protein